MVIGVDVAVVAVVFVIVVFVVAAVIAVVVVPRDLPLIFGQNRSVTLRYC